ncbi:efflux transporter outer membrane subunit [Haloferula chungangensis]|uniref:Efflux transporter outer membrane subunit n=1 Tax=Haloferula chungangensis TaxID=1048331 RepID=A0ABW2L709_9BACT
MKTISCCLLSALLAGCVSPPTEISNLSVPTSWQNVGDFPTGSASQDLGNWWSSFGDAELTRLIRRTYDKNPDIRSGAAAVRQAQAQREATASTLLPSLGYSGSAASGKIWNRDASDSAIRAYSADLTASWEIDFFGKNRQAVAAADSGIAAAQADLNATRASLAAETALAYFQLRAAEAGLAIVRESIVSQEETTQLASWREQAGEADGLEFEQSKAALESARAAIDTLEQTVAQSRNRLNLLAGETPGTLKVSAANALPQPRRSLAIGIPAETIRQRPDVRAAGFRWLAAIANTRSAEAEQFPSIGLSGSLGIDSLSSSKLFDPETVAASVIAGLTGPIFDGGRIRANIQVQDAVEEQNYEAYRKSILTALSEVEDALIACQRTESRIATLEKSVSAARSAADLAARKYEAGVIDITQVLDTQRSQLSTERDLLTARLDHSSAYVELYRALGGGR